MSNAYKSMFEAQKTINERLREEILQSERVRRELVTEKALLQDNVTHLQLHYSGKVMDAERTYMLLQDHSQQIAQINEGLQIENNLLKAQVLLQDREIRELSTAIDDQTMLMTHIQAAYQESTAADECGGRHAAEVKMMSLMRAEHQAECRALHAEAVERTVADAELRDALRAKTRKAKEQLKAETQKAYELTAQLKAAQGELDKLKPKAEHWRGNLTTVSKQLEAKTAEVARLQADQETATQRRLDAERVLLLKQAQEEARRKKELLAANVAAPEEEDAEPIADARAKEVAEKVVKAGRKRRAAAKRKEASASVVSTGRQAKQRNSSMHQKLEYVVERSAVRVEQLVKEVDNALNFRAFQSVEAADAGGHNFNEMHKLFAQMMKECNSDVE